MCFVSCSAPTLFKNIEAWDDTKNNYREGFPVKDSKAPKRRAQLMEAIAEADKEFLLPVEERVDGLLKVHSGGSCLSSARIYVSPNISLSLDYSLS